MVGVGRNSDLAAVIGEAVKPTYVTSNLWHSFCEECPLLCRIPLLGMWSFGHFVKAYFNNRLVRHEP